MFHFFNAALPKFFETHAAPRQIEFETPALLGVSGIQTKRSEMIIFESLLTPFKARSILEAAWAVAKFCPQSKMKPLNQVKLNHGYTLCNLSIDTYSRYRVLFKARCHSRFQEVAADLNVKIWTDFEESFPNCIGPYLSAVLLFAD